MPNGEEHDLNGNNFVYAKNNTECIKKFVVVPIKEDNTKFEIRNLETGLIKGEGNINSIFEVLDPPHAVAEKVSAVIKEIDQKILECTIAVNDIKKDENICIMTKQKHYSIKCKEFRKYRNYSGNKCSTTVVCLYIFSNANVFDETLLYIKDTGFDISSELDTADYKDEMSKNLENFEHALDCQYAHFISFMYLLSRFVRNMKFYIALLQDWKAKIISHPRYCTIFLSKEDKILNGLNIKKNYFFHEIYSLEDECSFAFLREEGNFYIADRTCLTKNIKDNWSILFESDQKISTNDQKINLFWEFCKFINVLNNETELLFQEKYSRSL
jgi:hypothetical protein